jgi:integrase
MGTGYANELSPNRESLVALAPSNQMLNGAIAFLYLSGWRVSEVSGLEWKRR